MVHNAARSRAYSSRVYKAHTPESEVRVAESAVSPQVGIANGKMHISPEVLIFRSAGDPEHRGVHDFNVTEEDTPLPVRLRTMHVQTYAEAHKDVGRVIQERYKPLFGLSDNEGSRRVWTAS